VVAGGGDLALSAFGMDETLASTQGEQGDCIRPSHASLFEKMSIAKEGGQGQVSDERFGEGRGGEMEQRSTRLH